MERRIPIKTNVSYFVNIQRCWRSEKSRSNYFSVISRPTLTKMIIQKTNRIIRKLRRIFVILILDVSYRDRTFKFAILQLLNVKLMTSTHIHQTGYREMNPTTNSFALSVHLSQKAMGEVRQHSSTGCIHRCLLNSLSFNRKIN